MTCDCIGDKRTATGCYMPNICDPYKVHDTTTIVLTTCRKGSQDCYWM